MGDADPKVRAALASCLTDDAAAYRTSHTLKRYPFCVRMHAYSCQ
ncbi:hypothetical protein HMPREF9622_00750 [Cutibacterium modestum HL037PA3]|nr:hypothetical protein HMPREF9621_01327 [Cutibacterium modestum HL037PA2]EFT16188.1 hypothetical protein HMPREF9622_00750 [Cutibacterium modestum HL037PA3]EGG27698.1 hypothetical protein PA08_0384 [Cutibacterium modestum P08]